MVSSGLLQNIPLVPCIFRYTDEPLGGNVKTMDHRQRLLLKTILGLYYNDF